MAKSLENLSVGIGKRVIDFGRKLVVGGVVAGALYGCQGSSSNNSNPTPAPTPNRAPVCSLEVSPSHGIFPFDTKIIYTGTDDKGIDKYKVGVNGSTIESDSPINTTITASEPLMVTGQCVDTDGVASVATQEITGNYPSASLIQSLARQNDVDLTYTASLQNIVGNATLELYKDEVLQSEFTRTIADQGYNETFTGMKKGDWKAVLRATGLDGNVVTKIDDDGDEDISDFPTEAIYTGSTSFNEDSQTNVQYNFSDRNPEDIPVTLTNASSIDGKTNVDFTSNGQITISNVSGQTGDYSVEATYQNNSGQQFTDTITGMINNLPDVSGFVQDSETDTGTWGKVRARDLVGTLLAETTAGIDGSFSLRVPQTGPYDLTAVNTDVNGNITSYTRRLHMDGSDQSELVVETASHVDIDGDGVIGDVIVADGSTMSEIDAFKTFMSEIHYPSIVRWDPAKIQGVAIFDNPITGESFSDGQKTLIRDILQDAGGLSGISNTISGANLNVDTLGMHYTVFNDSVRMNDGWIGIYPTQDTNGFAGLTNNGTFAGEIKKSLIKINPNLCSTDQCLRQIIPHEYLHGIGLASFTGGHTDTLTGEQSIMTVPIFTSGLTSNDVVAENILYSSPIGTPQEDILETDF